MNDNCKTLMGRRSSRQRVAIGYDTFATSLCDVILDRVTARRLNTHDLAKMGVFARRDDIMWLRDRELHLHWSLHRLAHFAAALGIHVEFSMRFDEDMKRAA